MAIGDNDSVLMPGHFVYVSISMQLSNHVTMSTAHLRSTIEKTLLSIFNYGAFMGPKLNIHYLTLYIHYLSFMLQTYLLYSCISRFIHPLSSFYFGVCVIFSCIDLILHYTFIIYLLFSKLHYYIHVFNNSSSFSLTLLWKLYHLYLYFRYS